MYILPVNQLSGKSNHLNVFKLVDHSHNMELRHMIYYSIKFQVHKLHWSFKEDVTWNFSKCLYHVPWTNTLFVYTHYFSTDFNDNSSSILVHQPNHHLKSRMALNYAVWTKGLTNNRFIIACLAALTLSVFIVYSFNTLNH